ncbi:MAG TPA: hypothetical protein VN894_21055 [Polyangiaceae bacterium]|nr:hypothetical protein [Polyangiaceae bacterium]
MGSRATAIACGALSAGAVGAALWMAAAAATGCYTHQCDPSSFVVTVGPASACEGGVFCDGPDAGSLVIAEPDGSGVMPLGADGQIRWQSTPFDGPWLEFPGQRTYTINFPQPFASPPEIALYLAADPADAEANFVVGGGNLAQLSALTSASVQVFNPSCARYGLRVVATGLAATAADGRDGDGGGGGGLQDATVD